MNIDSNVFIAPGAQIIGDVNIKSGSSFGTTPSFEATRELSASEAIPISRTWS